ncbi:MAG: hypothetical protein ACM33T_17000 [Solirubrobacterales bacterium]
MAAKVWVLFSAMALAGCQSSGTTPKAASEPLPTLGVAFAAPAWDGNTVPKDGTCQIFGGKGESPALTVSGIPAGVNAIVVEFSDRTYTPMDNGGHGVIGWKIEPGAATTTLRPVPGMTADVGEGAWIVRDNRAAKNPAPGYRGPCSGGKGNTYEADVKAVQKLAQDGGEGKVLATGRIRLGTY